MGLVDMEAEGSLSTNGVQGEGYRMIMPQKCQTLGKVSVMHRVRVLRIKIERPLARRIVTTIRLCTMVDRMVREGSLLESTMHAEEGSFPDIAEGAGGDTGGAGGDDPALSSLYRRRRAADVALG